jgi:hypothetical protein
VVLLPADIFGSQLADVPTDRFRIGVGRRDARPALEAFDQFLRADRWGRHRPCPTPRGGAALYRSSGWPSLERRSPAPSAAGIDAWSKA